MTCPDDIAFARAITGGPDAEMLAHLADCADCRAAWHGQRAAIELARKLEAPRVRADKREEMRTALLASPMPKRAVGASRRWMIVAGALAATAAAVVVMVVPRGGEVAKVHSHGTVVAAAGARYVLASTSPDEIVLLNDGVIDVEVSPLHAGERFRVMTADGEIEVHGTAFVVESHMGRVSSVRVRHGVVDVRPVGGPMAQLHAGEQWSAPITASITAPTTAPVTAPVIAPVVAPVIASVAAPAAVAAPASRVRRADKPAAAREAVAPQQLVAQAESAVVAPARSQQAVAYDAGWTAMRASDFAAASSAFMRASIVDPEGPLAEDATYFYAVALARAKRAEATTAFRDFVERYARSAHAGEANAMLGWLLVDAGQRGEAERRFRSAADDARADVRASAKAGLTALGAR